MAERHDGISGLALALAPTLLGLVGVIALALPLRMIEGQIPTPLLPLIVIYFWSIYGPNYMTSGSTFSVGLLQDFLLGGTLGVWASAYLVTQILILSQRSYFLGREQHVVWLGFLVAAGVAGLLVWAETSLLAGQWVTIRPLLWQMLVTVAFYPVLAVGFSSLHERVILEK